MSISGRLTDTRSMIAAAWCRLHAVFAVTANRSLTRGSAVPLLRAKLMLDKADKLAQKASETGAEREEAKRLLVHARYQLQMAAEALGYGDQKRNEQLTGTLDKVDALQEKQQKARSTTPIVAKHGRDPDDPARLGIPAVLRVSVSISGPQPTRRSTTEGASWRATKGSDFNCDSHATMGKPSRLSRSP